MSDVNVVIAAIALVFWCVVSTGCLLGTLAQKNTLEGQIKSKEEEISQLQFQNNYKQERMDELKHEIDLLKGESAN